MKAVHFFANFQTPCLFISVFASIINRSQTYAKWEDILQWHFLKNKGYEHHLTSLGCVTCPPLTKACFPHVHEYFQKMWFFSSQFGLLSKHKCHFMSL